MQFLYNSNYTILDFFFLILRSINAVFLCNCEFLYDVMIDWILPIICSAV